MNQFSQSIQWTFCFAFGINKDCKTELWGGFSSGGRAGCLLIGKLVVWLQSACNNWRVNVLAGWAGADCSFTFLYVAHRSRCSPCASSFNMLRIQRCSSAQLVCNEWLFELLLPSFQLKAAKPVESYHLCDGGGGHVGKSQQSNSIWNTHTNNYIYSHLKSMSILPHPGNSSELQVILKMSTRLSALSSCHVIG